ARQAAKYSKYVATSPALQMSGKKLKNRKQSANPRSKTPALKQHSCMTADVLCIGMSNQFGELTGAGGLLGRRRPMGPAPETYWLPPDHCIPRRTGVTKQARNASLLPRTTHQNHLFHRNALRDSFR